MKTDNMLFLALGLSGTLLAPAPAAAADLLPSIVTSLTGTLQVSQNIPCSDTVTAITPVTGGRFELRPAEGIDVGEGRKAFSLTNATLTFAPFSATGSCLGFSGTQRYAAIGVQLAASVLFVANPTETGGLFSFRIPKESIEFWEASIVNDAPENGYLRPAQDVTGVLDLTHGRASLHVVVATSIHFKEGCLGDLCAIDETDPGTLTTEVSGTVAFPDTDGDGVPDRTDNCRFVPNPSQAPVPTPSVTPPRNVTLTSCLDHQIGLAHAADVCDGGPVSVSNDAPAAFVAGANTVTWTAIDQKNRTATADQTVTIVDTTAPTLSCTPVLPLGNAYQVAASDICGAPIARLGSFVLGDHEIVKIDETGQRGVRFIGTVGPDHIRFFQVGKGQAVITATDTSGNVATAVCTR